MLKDRSAFVFRVGQPKKALLGLTDRQHTSSETLKRRKLFIARQAQHQEIFSKATVKTSNNFSVQICQLLFVVYLMASSVSLGLYNVDGRNMRTGERFGRKRSWSNLGTTHHLHGKMGKTTQNKIRTQNFRHR